MWMRLTLAFKRAAILKSRKRIWPIEASANSVPLKTSACRVLISRWAKAENHSQQAQAANNETLARNVLNLEALEQKLNHCSAATACWTKWLKSLFLASDDSSYVNGGKLFAGGGVAQY
jgi:hypothetical protein